MIILALALPLFAESAYAQQIGERKTLLELLFGTPKRTTPPATVPTRKKPKVTRTVKKAPQSATGASSKPAAPPPVAKLENARKILVVGDFIANGLSEGLEEAFAASPGVLVVGRGNGSSGLVRDDYYNWPVELPAILDEVKPELVVVEIGANDRQQITSSTGKEDFRTETWIKEYETRIATFAKLVTSRGLPLLWVGVPPFRPQNMTSDVLMLNGIYQKRRRAAWRRIHRHLGMGSSTRMAVFVIDRFGCQRPAGSTSQHGWNQPDSGRKAQTGLLCREGGPPSPRRNGEPRSPAARCNHFACTQ